MSKIDELIGVYIEASSAVVWEAEKRGLCPMTLDMQRAGIAAVVRALRDEMRDPSTFKSAKQECCGRGVPNHTNTAEECCCLPDTWLLHEELLGRINEILASSEGGQAAGGPTPETAGGVETNGQVSRATSDAPAAPAPVCEWRDDAYIGCFTTSCSDDAAWNRLGGTPKDEGYNFCPSCGKPISFKTEAQR